MAQECNCDTGLYNLQPSACVTTPGITRKFVFVEYFKADDRADPNFETVDNENLFVSQGTRTMSGNFYSTAADLASKLDGNRCVELGVFMIDSANGINAIVNRDLYLDPIRLNKETFWSKINFPTESNRFNVAFSTEWDRIVQDGDIRSLGFSDHGTDLLNKVGLIDVLARFGVANLATEIAIDLYDVDGSADGDAFTGLLVGDFTVFNETTALAVVPSAVVESPTGTYTFTIAAQTAADILTVTATQAGFDFSQTTNEKITAI